jgi:hypothetical protein
MFHADRRTERHDRANSRFRNFADAPKSQGTFCSATWSADRHTYTHILKHIKTYPHTIQTPTHTYTHTSTHTDTHTHTHTLTNIHTYAHIHTQTHTYAYTHKHTHIRTHTHADTHIRTQHTLLIQDVKENKEDGSKLSHDGAKLLFMGKML